MGHNDLSLALTSSTLFQLGGNPWELRIREEERQAERKRIAEDLHDTVLQDFYGASLLLNTALEQLPANLPSKLGLFRVLEILGGIIDGIRRTLKGAPLPEWESDDLPQELSRIGHQLSTDKIGFRVIISGSSRQLHPDVREDVYRIAHEAMVNAFRHSQATAIEVELEYGSKRFLLVVRDNGRGIDPEVLRDGREGHLGLRSMRERADKLSARFEVRSRLGAGTEIELSVPNGIAFDASR